MRKSEGMPMASWKYYNRAVLPNTPPHRSPDLTPVLENRIWKEEGRTAILARWTTEYDCPFETGWWYCVKDTPFEMDSLKAKRRYVIKQGIKNFTVSKINLEADAEEMLRVCLEAERARPSVIRKNNLTIDSFLKEVSGRDGAVYGAFDRDAGVLRGFARIQQDDHCIHLVRLTTDPEFEKMQVNAALIYQICQDYSDKLCRDFYLCDGERNIQDATAFQDYLIKYFGFRKAYCKLNLKIRPSLQWVINLAFLARKPFQILDQGSKLIHKINGVLQMKQIIREDVKLFEGNGRS